MKRGVLGILTVLVATVLAGLGPVPAADADPTSAATLPVTVTLPVAARGTYGRAVQLTATVVARTADGTEVPVPGAKVTFRATTNKVWHDLGHDVTGSKGRAWLSVVPHAGWHSVRAVVDATAPDPSSHGPLAPGTKAGASPTHSMHVARATVHVQTTGRTIRSESATMLRVHLRSPTLSPSALAHRRVRVTRRAWSTSAYTGGRWVTTDGHGDLSLRVRTWHGVSLRLRVPRLADTAGAVRVVSVRTRGILSTVRQAPHPATPFPAGRAPAGNGVHLTSRTVPDAVWQRMVGVSWHRGCPVGRRALRYIQLNYWGFDGYRHRGAIIVNKAIVGDAEGAFRALYNQRFRIRRIQPEDSWGRNPKGPGANDYAAMREDDTSGFNCRYVDGRESQHVWSPHAYGTAIDVNTFENPYVARTGTFPDTYWRRHRHGVGVLSRGSAAVRAFTSRGFFWGARWNAPDFQHFQQ